ncbi:MAG: hypothetical protein QM695_05675 [Micropruina sp.]
MSLQPQPPTPTRSTSDVGAMGDEAQTSTDSERRSLDLVQRTVVSLLLGGVIAMVASVLALFVVTRAPVELPYDSVIGLWIMTGVIGLAGAVPVLIINRRRPYHPLVILGLIPMAVAGYWLFS